MFKNIVKNSDLLYILILLFIVSIMFYFFGNCILLVYSDIGREMYISSQVANGAVLYKDIFNIFMPMGYFLNAIVIKIFGDSINTFVAISYVLTLLILLSMYKILNLYVNKATSFFTTLVVLFTCPFISTCFNWNLPYSYSLFYSLASVMWALYFLLKYVTEDNSNKYLYFSLFLYSFSISCKYDLFLFIFVVILAQIYKKAYFKDYLITLCSVIVFPLISFIILFYQKCTLNDLLFTLAYLKEYVKSMHFFYQYVGILPGDMLISKLTHFRFESFYSSLGYINIIILFIYLLKKYPFKHIILCIASIVLSAKSILNINLLHGYGPFFFHILFMNFVVFLSGIIKKQYWLNVLLIIAIFLNSYYFLFLHRDKYKPIHTDKGTFQIWDKNYESTRDLLNYINNNSQKADKILVAPEGALINYLTDRPTNGYLFHLIFPNYEALGEDFIINLFLSQHYKYVIFHSHNYPEYGRYSPFIENWGQNFYKIVSENYDFKIKFVSNNGFTYYVYKLKE